MTAYPKIPKAHLVGQDRTNPVWERRMAKITKEEYRTSAARGLDIRDVLGAWFVCALLASIALAVSSDFIRQLPPHPPQLL